MYKSAEKRQLTSVLHSPLVFVLMLALIIQSIYYSHQSVTIGTVNITAIISSFVKETAKQNLTMKQKQKKVNKFGLSMQRVMIEMAQKKHMIIMLSESVIAGSRDYTKEVMVQVKKEMAL